MTVTILFAFIPVGIYMLMKRLRYLGRLNEQHRNILESNLNMDLRDLSFPNAEADTRLNKPEMAIKKNKGSFEIPLHIPVQQKAI